MAIRVDDLPHYTPAQYRRLVEAAPDDALAHTELIDGVIYHVLPISPLHGRVVAWLTAQLEGKYPDRVYTGVTVEFPHSQWEPDICVAREGARVEPYNWLGGFDLALAVEVSVTSQSRDLGPKLRDYGRAGVPDYWVIDPSEGGWLLTHGDPHDGTYRALQRIELPGGYRDLDVDEMIADQV
jgi:Uma2 family endonuclease